MRGEVLWPDEHDGGYHYFPAPDQLDAWLAQAGFTVAESATGDGVQHLLALLSAPASPG